MNRRDRDEWGIPMMTAMDGPAGRERWADGRIRFTACLFVQVLWALSSPVTGRADPAKAPPDHNSPPDHIPLGASTEDFLRSIGVNQHVGYSGTTYANVSLELRELKYLGVKLVRDQAPTLSNLEQYRQLATSGVKFDLIIAPAGQDVALTLPDDITAISALSNSHPGSVFSIEGPNELNGQIVNWRGVSSNIPATGISVMRALSEAVRANSRLKGVAVVNLSIHNATAGWRKYLTDLGNLSPYVDFANWHVYFDGGSQPLSHVTSMLQDALRSAPGKPVIFTETGYSTADQDFYGVDEETQATNILNLLADAYKAGVRYIYLYELMEGALHSSATDIENRYGLFHGDGAPKPAATAVHNLTSILGQDIAEVRSSSDRVLEYSFVNLPRTGASISLRKTRGVHDLMVWDEKRNWDPYAHQRIPVQPTDVTVNLGATYSSVTVFDPIKSPEALLTLRNVSHMNIELRDHPLILEVME